MRNSRTPWTLCALGLVAGLVGIFLWDDVIAPGLGFHDPDSGLSELEQYEADQAERMANLRTRATLRGLPGVDRRLGGTGVLRGTVLQHVPGGTPRPLAGVIVRLIAVKPDGTPVKYALETGADGVFEELKAEAVSGYLLSIRHPPFKEKLLRGIRVRPDHVKDVHEILLGAPTTLTGEVRTAQGGPPIGARVEVLRDQSRPDNFDLRRSLFDLQSANDFLAEADVDRDGQFHIDDLSPGRYVLRISAPGYATVFRSGVIVTLDEHSSEPRVTLDKGAGYEGVIRDEDGQGIAAARVVAVAVSGSKMTRIDRVDTVSASDGRYRIDRLTPGVRYLVEGWAEGYAPSGSLLLVGEGVKPRDIVLQAAGAIQGRLVDGRSGRGISDAEVTIIAGSLAKMSPVSTVTDGDGNYQFLHVSAGNLLLFSAHADGYQEISELQLMGVKKGETRLQVVAGETTTIDWSLLPGGTIEGQVTSSTGRPVPYVTVAVVDRGRRMVGESTALTDESGRYQIAGLRAAEYDLRIAAPGYAPVTDDAQARVQVPDTLGATIRDIVLWPGATLIGTVKTPEGAPMGGASITVKAAGGSSRVRERVRDLVAISDAAGAYVLPGIPPGVPIVAVAAHDAYVRVQSESLTLTPGQERKLSLVLRPGASLPGRVTDSRGVALADARVRWGNVDDIAPRRLRDAFRADEYLGPRVLYTDADGKFEIPNLEPGKTLVKVAKEGFGDWYRHDLTIGTEGIQPVLQVELAGALSIAGRVVSDGSGAPIADALLYCQEGAPPEGTEPDPGKVRALATAYTNARGFFTLEGLPPGRYEVVVWFATGFKGGAVGRDDQNRRRDVSAGSKDVTFRLVPPPELPSED